jgi:hypothetical protein
MITAGFARADITPPIGAEMPGNFGKNYVQAIREPLWVHAGVLDDGACPLVFVSVDTCEIQSPLFFDAVTASIAAHTGIPAAQVLIAATHTHSGGPLAWLHPTEFAHAPDDLRDLITQHTINADPDYMAHAIAQTVAAVRQAWDGRAPARVSCSSGHEGSVAFCRRFVMKDGRIFTHPGKGNPDIVAPEGPIDPEVGVVGAWGVGEREGQLLGCIVNYACHCTTMGGNAASADYVTPLIETITGTFGPQVEVIFLTGAMGDITQVDNLDLRLPEFGPAWSNRVGRTIGAEAVKVLARGMHAATDALTLAARAETLTLRRRRPSPERLAECRARVADGLRSGVHDTPWHFAVEIVVLDWLCEQAPAVQTQVQALQVGPAVFVTNTSEYFARSGLAIKAASPFPLTYVVTLAGPCIGYVPPAECFDPATGGGYETVLNSYANMEIGAERAIREASIRLTQALTPGALPQPERITERKAPWHYGNMPPQLS